MDKFNTPTSKYRPLRIIHGFNFTENEEQSTAKKQEIINLRLDDLNSKGYGGIVTNVCFKDYLKSEENWHLYKYTIESAISKGLRIWIYDEEGYPSGGAGGVTLENHPEFEAKALVSISHTVGPNEKVIIEKPYGHMDVIAAYAMQLTCKPDNCKPFNEAFYSKPEDLIVDNLSGVTINLMDFIGADGTLKWSAPNDNYYAVFYFVWKPLYEGTHAQHNVHASRRYISVINKDAVKEFIHNTYNAYLKHSGQYFGNEIEAFFTDEPSFMAAYLNAGLYPKRVDDAFDENVALLPVISWEHFIPDVFMDRYGYDLMASLHYLFSGTTAQACLTRYHFYNLLSDLYEEAFFKQIGDFCTEHKIEFSGHLLLEEQILHHAIYEGNFFKLLSHMGIPGIDMLTTIPKNVLQQAATPKLVSSIARWYGKPHVMTETSGHMQTSAGAPFGLKEMLGSIGIQYVLGVDIFTSYYDDFAITPEENKIFCEYTGRIGEMMDGGEHFTRIAVYYPIESAWLGTKGSDKQLGEREYGKGLIDCQNSWLSIIDILLKSQLDFDCIDNSALLSGASRGLDSVMGPSGVKYDILIIPKVVTLSYETICILKTLARNGVKMVFDGILHLVSTNDSNIEQELHSLLVTQNVFNVASCTQIPNIVRSLITPDVYISTHNSDILYAAKTNTSFGFTRAYLFVNTSNDAVETDVFITSNQANSIKIFNPFDATIDVPPIELSVDGKLIVKLRLDGYMGKIIGIVSI